jgi:nitroimidazol reductase NimA-like FMN-containing flavoprotein (pyridoxamine 5'-phosphate oxidase superfamily)
MLKPFHGPFTRIDIQAATELIKSKNFGHLGCHDHAEVYVVPISYVLDAGKIYSHSRPGKKLEMMKKNREVCLQVEDINSFSSWTSAIAWGEFEELKGGAASTAMRLLIKVMAERDQTEYASSLELDLAAQLERSVIYQIDIKKITGQSEG